MSSTRAAAASKARLIANKKPDRRFIAFSQHSYILFYAAVSQPLIQFSLSFYQQLADFFGGDDFFSVAVVAYYFLRFAFHFF